VAKKEHMIQIILDFMADDFKKTAKRMGKSSSTLHNAREFYNACYLGGYVIESYAKILIGLLGTSHGNEHRIPVLIGDVERNYLLANSTLIGKIRNSGVAINLRTDFAQISRNWHPYKRYAGVESWNVRTSTDFQAEITLALQHIARLEVNGVI
jgi:hypothetical protein